MTKLMIKSMIKLMNKSVTKLMTKYTTRQQNWDSQLMTKLKRPKVGRVIRYCKLATIDHRPKNSHLYANFSHFFSN